jgi:hypothetical protein
MNIRRTAAMASIALVLGTLSALPASAQVAKGGVERQGKCSGNSDWRLRADPDSGRIRVEAEVDSGVKGQHWSWRILHNGGESFRGNAVTDGGGSYKVQRLIIDLPGKDRIVFKSHNGATGEQCNGSVKY